MRGHDTEIMIPAVLPPQSKGRREPSGRAEGVATHAAGAGNFQAEPAEIGAPQFFELQGFGKIDVRKN